MADHGENDVVHLKAGDQLPAVPYASPTAETLKQLLEQMLENERRRLRNEYIRIAMVFFALLITAAGGGIWFAHNLLDQLRAERQITERSLRALLRHDDQGRGEKPEVRDQSSAIINQQPGSAGALRPGESDIGNLSAPGRRADPDTLRAQADIKRMITDLESTKLALADLLKAQNAQTRELLKTRDSDLQILHERMQEVQHKIMNTAPLEAQPSKKNDSPPADSVKPADSLTVMTPNSVTLRLPIPGP